MNCTLREYLSSPPVFVGVYVACLFSFCVLSYYVSMYDLSSVLGGPLQFLHKNDVVLFVVFDVRFVFLSSCL